MAQHAPAETSMLIDLGYLAGTFILGLLSAVFGKYLGKNKKKNKQQRAADDKRAADKLVTDSYSRVNSIKNFKYDQIINQILIELLTDTDAARAQVLLFHNGEHYRIHNMSIQRFTCAYERVAAGIAPAAEYYTRKLISHYIDGLELIVEAETGVAVIDTSDLPDCPYKAGMLATHSKIHVGMPLYWRKQLVGILLVSFMDEKRRKSDCSFRNIVGEGAMVDTQTKTVELRHCQGGKCADCKYKRYVLRLEAALEKNTIEDEEEQDD